MHEMAADSRGSPAAVTVARLSTAGLGTSATACSAVSLRSGVMIASRCSDAWSKLRSNRFCNAVNSSAVSHMARS
jgi:hypothetical protein